MLTRMTGTLTRVLDDEARVEVGAFEYQVLVPEAVRRQLQLHAGREVTFHLTEYLEGNPSGSRFIPRRIGFLTELDLEFFELFCTVEKIGSKKALKAMARPAREIADAINRQDSRWLSTLPGIGATTAEQIVTTLKRKVTKFLMAATPPATSDHTSGAIAAAEVSMTVVDAPKPSGRKKLPPEPNPASALPDGTIIEDVYQALMGLGHNPQEARTRLDSLLSSGKAFKSLDEALTLIYANRGNR